MVMTKNNTETRATLLQRVSHLAEKVTGLEETVDRLGGLDAQRGDQIAELFRRIEKAESHLDSEAWHLTNLRIAFSDHRNMTIGQRLNWLLRGRR